MAARYKGSRLLDIRRDDDGFGNSLGVEFEPLKTCHDCGLDITGQRVFDISTVFAFIPLVGSRESPETMQRAKAAKL